MREVDIEGYTANEILNVPDEQLMLLSFQVGSLCFVQAVQKYLASSKSKVRVGR